jgi:hypothetical protein
LTAFAKKNEKSVKQGRALGWEGDRDLRLLCSSTIRLNFSFRVAITVEFYFLTAPQQAKTGAPLHSLFDRCAYQTRECLASKRAGRPIFGVSGIGFIELWGSSNHC